MSEITRYRSLFSFFKRLMDMLLPFGMLYFVVTRYGLAWTDRYMLLGMSGGVLFMISNQFFGTYDNWRGRSMFESLQLVLKAWATTVVLLIILAFLFKRSHEYSRVAIAFWSLLMPLLFLCMRFLTRMVLRYTFSCGFYTKKVAIAGGGKVGRYLVKMFRETPGLGYEVTGIYDDEKVLVSDSNYGVTMAGDFSKASSDAREGLFDELYLCLPLGAEKQIVELLNALSQTTVVVKYVPDLFAFDLLHAKWIDMKGLPVISVYDSPMNSLSARFVKRSEDILVSLLILLFIWPVMLFVAIGVRLSSPGPVFYRQTRIGWNGRPFTILKFRSMPVNNEKDGIKWGDAVSKTHTRFGKFIRQTSLDELPQFMNVLMGDMSIVGPRPERDIFIDQISQHVPRYMQRHMVKTGITGWAQIHGWRGDTCLHNRIEHDLYYISNWSLWFDLKIIVLTAMRGWIDKNAC